MAGVLEEDANVDPSTVAAELQRASDREISRYPRALSQFELLQIGFYCGFCGIRANGCSHSLLVGCLNHRPKLLNLSRSRYGESLGVCGLSSGILSQIVCLCDEAVRLQGTSPHLLQLSRHRSPLPQREGSVKRCGKGYRHTTANREFIRKRDLFPFCQQALLLLTGLLRICRSVVAILCLLLFFEGIRVGDLAASFRGSVFLGLPVICLHAGIVSLRDRRIEPSASLFGVPVREVRRHRRDAFCAESR